MYTLKVGNRISKRGFLVAGTTAVVTCTCTLRTRNPFSTSDRLIPPIRTFTNHVPGWSTLGDQTGPVDIRGARPLHSGCCEAVLECASHAVDSRIFGSKASNSNKKQAHGNKESFLKWISVKCVFFVFVFFSRGWFGWAGNLAFVATGCIAQR